MHIFYGCFPAAPLKGLWHVKNIEITRKKKQRRKKNVKTRNKIIITEGKRAETHTILWMIMYLMLRLPMLAALEVGQDLWVDGLNLT